MINTVIFCILIIFIINELINNELISKEIRKKKLSRDYNVENFVRVLKPRSFNNNYYQTLDRQRKIRKPGEKKINNRLLKNILKLTEDNDKICNKDFKKVGKRINQEVLKSKYYNPELMKAQQIFINANCSESEEPDIYNNNQTNHDGCFIVNKKKKRDFVNKRKNIDTF